MIDNGGTMIVSQKRLQYIYLDFDGAETAYNGELLTVDNVEVADSLLTQERIDAITAILNEEYAGQNVIFTSDKSDLSDYSTIYIGHTDALGDFTGLAETLDTGNKNYSDNAFVNLDHTATDTEIAAVISHEAGHLLYGQTHEGEGMETYGRTTSLTVSQGVISSNLKIGNSSTDDAERVQVYGIADSATINSSGVMNIFSGGTANSTTVKSRGVVNIFSGGVANSTTVISGGSMRIVGSGVANSTTVNSSGYLYISSGGVANSTTVNSSGYLYISSGGVANSTVVKKGGSMCIYSGGVASAAEVDNLIISRGGTAYDVKVSAFGSVDVADGGIITFASMTYNNLTLNENNDYLYVYDNTTANTITVNSSGHLYISSGGVANSVTVNSDGVVYIDNGGAVNSAVVNSYGWLHISSGGTAHDIKVSAFGWVSVEEGAVATFASMTYNNLTVNDDNAVDLYIYENTVANNTTVDSYGYLEICSGVIVNYTTVKSDGCLNIFSGGVANSTVVEKGGSMCIYSGGVASAAEVDNLIISRGGTAYDVKVSAFGSVDVADGGIITFASMTYNNLTLNENNDYLYVYDNTTANTITVNSYCRLYISSGGVANSTTVNSDGDVYNRGVANSTTVNGGWLCISNGGVANSTTVNGGWLSISNGGVANSTTVNSDGVVYIDNGGAVNSAVVNSAGVVYISGGATANCTVVSEGGVMEISRSGVANSTTVNSGGALLISGIHSGALQIMNGAAVSAEYGAVIDFDISAHDNPETAIITNWNLISGGNNADYTLTVTDNLTSGKYKLASGASDFDSTISVKTSGGTNSGVVSLENYLSNNGTLFFLLKSVGDLYIKIDVAIGEITQNTFSPTNKDVTVTAAFGESIVSKQYRIGDGAWTNYSTGVTVSQNAVVYFMAVDNAGNISEKQYSVTNINKVAPTITVTPSTTAVTYQNVIVKAVFADDTAVKTKQYRIDNGAWQDYVDGVTVTTNGTVYFRAQDAHGNETIEKYAVTNIDKPVKIFRGTELVSSAMTMQNVTLAADTMHISSGGVAISTAVNTYGSMYISSGGVHSGTLQIMTGATVSAYSGATIDFDISNNPETAIITNWNLISGGNDADYTLTVKNNFTSGKYNLATGVSDFNRTISVKNTGGSVLGVVSCSSSLISNGLLFSLSKSAGELYIKIDAPVGEITQNVSSPTNKDVTVTASFGENLVSKQYRIGNGAWTNYSNGVTVSQNTVVYFKAVDNAGNSAEKQYSVTNINKVAPTITVTPGTTSVTYQNVIVKAVFADDTAVKTKQYRIDNGAWQDYVDGVTVTTNGTVYFRAQDAHGNETIEKYAVTNIDKPVKIFRGTELVSSAMTMQNIALASGGVDAMHISSGGSASSTTINSGGCMHISSGGTASSTTINSDGCMYISGGGTASAVNINSGGLMEAHSGAFVQSATLVRGGSAVISGADVNTFTLMSRGSATVTDTVLKNAELFSSARLDCVSDKESLQMAVSGALVHSNGVLTMSSRTCVSDAVVSKAGKLYIENGGSAYRTRICDEGIIEILGVTANTTMNGGSMYVGDSSYRDYDGTGGRPTQNEYDEDIHASVNVLNSSWLHVYSGGTATSNSISSNSWLHVYYGGTATSNVINSSGYLTVQDSGTVDTVMLYSAGYMRLYTGAILKGDINVGGKVTVETAGTSQTEDVVRAYGANINYLVSERQDGDESIITDLGMIMGATFFATVNTNQASGTYKLADGAADFTGSITIRNTDGASLGTVTTGGTISSGGCSYTLVKNEDNLALTVVNNAPVVTPPADKSNITASDINGNGISDVMFQYTGGDYQLGFWMDGTNTWRSQSKPEPQEWEVLGAYDMDSSGKADAVLVGNVTVSGIKGAFIGYYKDADTSAWENISYLTNAEGIVWKNKVGNLTGHEGKNSIVWHAPELGALGVWTDGTDNWVSLGGGYDASWVMSGTGDFDGDGKDEVLFNRDGAFYSTDIDGKFNTLANIGQGWEVRATGDFTGDGKDDIIVFHKETGLVGRLDNGLAWNNLGQLDAADWFVVGAGEYNGTGAEDLLVRQYSTGMLGYYADGDMSRWVELGRGVDMDWTVIA